MKERERPEYPWQLPAARWTPEAGMSEAERRREGARIFFEIEETALEFGFPSDLVYDKTGSVHVRVYVPVKLRHLYNGQRRVSVYGRTEEEALAKRDALRRDMDRRKTRSGSQAFGDYLAAWLESLGALKLVGERTLQDYRYACEKHLIPRRGPVVLEDLTAEDLDDLYARLRREGVGVRTVNHVHSTARVALQRAVKNRLIPFNPARDADPPPYSTDGREYATLSEEDVPRFFEAAKGDRFEALFVLSVLTGVRPAEARALR